MTPITNNAQKTDLIIYYRNGLKNNTVTKPSADKQALSKTICGISIDNIVYQKGLGVNRSWLAHIQAENSIEVIFWLQKSALPLEY